jgi:hypothetical protein
MGRLEGATDYIKTTVKEIKIIQEADSGRITRLDTRVTLLQRWGAPITFLGGVFGSILAKLGMGTLIDL